jgi:hypothetical protein
MGVVSNMTIILQFTPNGEFTHGYDSSKRRKSRVDKLQEKLVATKAPAIAKEICADIDHEVMSAQTFEGVEFSSKSALYTCLRRHDAVWMYAVEPFDENIEPYVVESEHNPIRYSYLVGSESPLGLSDATNFTERHKTRKPCMGLTKRMARTIRNAGYLLEQQYGKDNLSFLTLTLPDLPEEGLQACAANWGRMVDRFLKWLRSAIEAKGGQLDYTYCTEVQTKRLKARGEYALHLHLLFGGRVSKTHSWYVQPSKVRKAWVRCIKSVYSGVFTDTALENLQRVKKSAAGYIAKYVSKGTSGNTPRRDDSSIPWFTGHWGGVSRNLRRLIRQASFRISEGVRNGEIARCLLRAIPGLVSRGVIKYYRAGFVATDRCNNETHRRGIHVGVGCLATPTYKLGLAYLFDAIREDYEKLRSNEM